MSIYRVAWTETTIDGRSIKEEGMEVADTGARAIAIVKKRIGLGGKKRNFKAKLHMRGRH